MIEDVTAAAEAAEAAARLGAIVDATTDLVVVSDPRGGVLYVNDAARRHLGLPVGVSLERLGDLDALDAFGDAARRTWVDEVLPAVRAGRVWSGELSMRRHDGRDVPVSQVVLGRRDDRGVLQWIASVSRDISDRVELEARMVHQATHDPLTGLPNRLLLLDRLDLALARARRHPGESVALLFCDLDHFKWVNDSLGHAAGDRLLVTMAERIRSVVRPSDTVARFGGDEFVVLCDGLADPDDAVHIAERLIEVVTTPVVLADTEVVVSTSIGIAFNRRRDARSDDLVRDADAAMYQAKGGGRNRFEVFDDEMRARAMERLDTERRLRRALERRELRLHYQPTIDLRDRRITGFEALLRWEDPERGLLGPDDFIALSEETGQIVEIGDWALRQACKQLQRWQAAHPGLERLQVSVNLSARQVQRDDLVERVASALAETGLDPRCLVLEITETVLMSDAADAAELLSRLKALGVGLAIDDFGTGYSSLAYLRRFPVDVLKIDREFVAGLGRDPEDAAIAELVLTLAHSLGLEAVAEGVEADEQLTTLTAMGFDRAQGFLFGKPLPPAAIDDLLASTGG